MNILSITAGTPGMFCGSCLRDNGLAAELLGRGHRVTLLPIYTPTRTDEQNVSHGQVFFGGVSVYLQQYLPLFRRTPWLLDRIWDSPMVLRALAGRSISADPALLGELTISMLKGERGYQGKEIQKLLHWLSSEPRPDVINLPNSLLIALAEPLKRALGAPICCTLQGEELFLDGLRDRYRGPALDLIRQSLAHVDVFVAISEYYVDFMAGYLGIPKDRIRLVPLGINLDGYDGPRTLAGRSFRLGYFARIAPEKGLHVLAEAYRILRKELGLRTASLEVAGSLSAEHRPYLAGVRKKLREWGLEDELHYHGVLDRAGKIAFLKSLHVLSVPAPYAEPKGVYLLEAMACGVPVVEPRRGAYPEILTRTGGGVITEPDDPRSLARAILELQLDSRRAEELGRRGAEGVRRHYSVAGMADATLAVYNDLVAREGAAGLPPAGRHPLSPTLA